LNQNLKKIEAESRKMIEGKGTGQKVKVQLNLMTPAQKLT
jgi:hypothetical protein